MTARTVPALVPARPGTRSRLARLAAGLGLTLCLALPSACTNELGSGDGGNGGGDGAPAGTGEVRSDVKINGRPAATADVSRLEATFGITVPPGDYWHDARSGLAGTVGGPSQAYAPGFDFGAVARDASHGNTGVLFNGRELSYPEASFVAALYDIDPQYIPQLAGSYVLERTGDLYRQDGTYLGNLAQLAEKKGKARSGGGDGMWCTKGGACGNSGGGCSYVTIPSSSGGTSVSASSGCGLFRGTRALLGPLQRHAELAGAVRDDHATLGAIPFAREDHLALVDAVRQRQREGRRADVVSR